MTLVDKKGTPEINFLPSTAGEVVKKHDTLSFSDRQTQIRRKVREWTKIIMGDIKKLENSPIPWSIKSWGITIRRNHPDQYEISSFGEGSHFSATAEGLRPHLRKEPHSFFLISENLSD